MLIYYFGLFCASLKRGYTWNVVELIIFPSELKLFYYYTMIKQSHTYFLAQSDVSSSACGFKDLLRIFRTKNHTKFWKDHITPWPSRPTASIPRASVVAASLGLVESPLDVGEILSRSRKQPQSSIFAMSILTGVESLIILLKFRWESTPRKTHTKITSMAFGAPPIYRNPFFVGQTTLLNSYLTSVRDPMWGTLKFGLFFNPISGFPSVEVGWDRLIIGFTTCLSIYDTFTYIYIHGKNPSPWK